MSESSCASLGFIELFDELPLGLFMACNDHLRYALSVLNDEVLGREIHKDDADFSPVVGINGSGSIQYRDAMLDGQATARPHLGFHSGR